MPLHNSTLEYFKIILYVEWITFQKDTTGINGRGITNMVLIFDNNIPNCS